MSNDLLLLFTYWK